MMHDDWRSPVLSLTFCFRTIYTCIVEQHRWGPSHYFMSCKRAPKSIYQLNVYVSGNKCCLGSKHIRHFVVSHERIRQRSYTTRDLFWSVVSNHYLLGGFRECSILFWFKRHLFSILDVCFLKYFLSLYKAVLNASKALRKINTPTDRKSVV